MNLGNRLAVGEVVDHDEEVSVPATEVAPETVTAQAQVAELIPAHADS